MAQSCVFSKQSQGPISESSNGSQGKPDYHRRIPLSRSYGDILPSSLTSVLPSACGCSPCRPVLVLVRIPVRLARRYFLEDDRATCGPKAPHSPLGPYARDLPGAIPRAWTVQSYRIWLAVTSPTRRCSSVDRKYRNINRSSIVYGFRPRLRVRLTLGGFTFPRKP